MMVSYVKIIECCSAGLQSMNKTAHSTGRPHQMYYHTVRDDTEAVSRCEFVGKPIEKSKLIQKM